VQGGAGCDGIVFRLNMTPALAAPVQVTSSVATADAGERITLTWQVLNAFSIDLAAVLCVCRGGAGRCRMDRVAKWTYSATTQLYTGSAAVIPATRDVHLCAHLRWHGVGQRDRRGGHHSDPAGIDRSLRMAKLQRGTRRRWQLRVDSALYMEHHLGESAAGTGPGAQHGCDFGTPRQQVWRVLWRRLPTLPLRPTRQLPVWRSASRLNRRQ